MVKRLRQRFKQLYRRTATNAKAQEAALATWFDCSLGQQLINAERELVARAISGRFAGTMVQLDSGYHQPIFEKRLFGSGILVAQLENRAPCPVLCAEPENLPFQPESIDMLLMHHTLDVCEDPYQAVREGAVALKPGGLLIIIGFNPFSFWGLRSMIQSRSEGSGVWNSRFIRSGRVEDWMQLLDFEVERNEKHVFMPPFDRPSWLKRRPYRFNLQRALLPVSGAVYLLVGYKRVFAKTNLAKKKIGGLLEPMITTNTHMREQDGLS